MTHEEVQEIATANNLGDIHFQFNLAQNTGKYFEAGYVFHNGKKVLFCKSPSRHTDFYLCNEFRALNNTQ